MTKTLVSSFLFLAISFSHYAMGSALTPVFGSDSIEEVKIAKEAKLTLADRTAILKLVGAGLRYKKVAFFKANVYVGEFFVDNPEKFQKSKEGALASLDNQKSIAIRMSFLRDVEGEKVQKSFQEALKENKISADDASVKQFLDFVKNGGEAKDKTTLTIIGEKLADGKEMISYENSKGTLSSVTGGAGFVKTIFSIWFGKIDDSGLESLRDSILGLNH